MTAPETQELRARTDAQLREDLEGAHQALFNLRFQAATRQLADNSQVRKARRRVARIKTLLRERLILAEAGILPAPPATPAEADDTESEEE